MLPNKVPVDTDELDLKATGKHRQTRVPTITPSTLENKWRALSARSKSVGTLKKTPNQTGEGSKRSAEHRTHYRSRCSRKTRCNGSADEP